MSVSNAVKSNLFVAPIQTYMVFAPLRQDTKGDAKKQLKEIQQQEQAITELEDMTELEK